MGSLFSAPKVNSAGARTNLAKLQGNSRYGAGGLTVKSWKQGRRVAARSDPKRQRVINELSDTYMRGFDNLGNVLGSLDDLRDLSQQIGEQWAPGASALRESQLTQLGNLFGRRQSDLREDFARRRVAGSLAQDSFNRAALEQQQAQEDVIAKTYLMELDAQQKNIEQQRAIAAQKTATINAQVGMKAQAYNARLNNWNLEAGLAQSMSAQAANLRLNAAKMQQDLIVAQAEADAANKAGIFELVGTVGGLFL